MSAPNDLITATEAALRALGVDREAWGGEQPVHSPLSGEPIMALRFSTPAEVEAAVGAAHDAWTTWRTVPAPVRGQVVRRLGELITEHKSDLATLVTIEAGKITSEALGEVQEMIDICDFAVGLSRQLYGNTMPSERPGHRLQEVWHPIGVVGVISAFNFPVAVWSWNTAVALACGDTVVWKPSELTPLTALACHALLERALRDCGQPADIHRLVLGAREVGEALVDDPRVALVSATGSSRMGAEVGPRVAARFGRSLLELGGNNACVITPHANLDIAVPAIVFGAAGTAGQRCTTTRRVIVHESMADDVVARVARAYDTLQVGDPRAEGVLVGPLITARSGEAMAAALKQAADDGGTVVTGGDPVDVDGLGGCYVKPALVAMPEQRGAMLTETFAPIVYVVSYTDLDEALALHNAVEQGLSGAIFTDDVAEAERFLAAADTGIANVNAGTSGAEIGGAFGGEKHTGGGRESGSDAWKAYMRRSTNTINYSGATVLAQGVRFS